MSATWLNRFIFKMVVLFNLCDDGIDRCEMSFLPSITGADCHNIWLVGQCNTNDSRCILNGSKIYRVLCQDRFKVVYCERYGLVYIPISRLESVLLVNVFSAI